MSGTPVIVSMTAAEITGRLDEFCDLLVDIVDGGASVGFMAPLSRETSTR